MKSKFYLGFIILGLSSLLLNCQFSTGKVDFNAEVRPILNKNCLACHGGVKQNGGFSLLFEEEALGETDSGEPAIIPGKPKQSELIKRLTHHDPEMRMPYDKAPLKQEEIEILEKWIAQGAKWESHWAYVAPVQSKVPTPSYRSAAKNEIDAFINRKLKEANLPPGKEADCVSLIRRLSLDLIGLPPSQEMVDGYCSNPSEENYQNIVQQLLDMPQYGERWAALWLDLARYADTKGYERDPHREIWAYRDWLIKAFNDNLPYDQFTIEQIAGDMLPNASASQYTATAFHRNTMTNVEGGTNDEEFRTTAVIDRVNTTWQVWMGTTFGCVQCHSHPYDPFRQEEYYEFYDFFNQSADADIPAETPTFRFLEQADSVKLAELKDWVKRHTNNENEISYYEDLVLLTEPKIHNYLLDSLTNGALLDNKFLTLYEEGYTIMRDIPLDGKDQLLINFLRGNIGSRLEFRVDHLHGPLLAEIDLYKKTRGYEAVKLNTDLTTGRKDIYIKHIVKNKDWGFAINWFVFFESLPGQEETGYTDVQETFMNLLNTSAKSVPVMVQLNQDYRRQSHVFDRGAWQMPTTEVNADVPGIMPALMVEEAEPDRLKLAQWIASKENPLTARVAVNRFWEQLFGRGLVETIEDFGTMGMPPSHPQLLDWLAVEFQEKHQWDMKSFLTYLVSSSTYRRSSFATDDMLQKDPQNRLLARGPRIRLSAEKVRDQALAVSGLLSKKMYGPSVMPPQPEGLWKVVYNGAKWRVSEGEDRYRRGLYTYMRRTSPYPSFLTFDAPSREICTVRRINTNTPLQALVTLNDPVYMEAAVYLAKSILNKHEHLEDQLAALYQKSLYTKASTQQLQELKEVFDTAREHYRNSPEEAQALLADIPFAIDCEDESCLNLAAMTLVANTVMNLDEFLVKS